MVRKGRGFSLTDFIIPFKQGERKMRQNNKVGVTNRKPPKGRIFFVFEGYIFDVSKYQKSMSQLLKNKEHT